MRFLHDHNLQATHRGLCLLGLLAFPLLAGCGGGGGGSNGNPSTGTTTTGTTTGTNTGTQPALSASATTKTGLTASLSEASSTVSVGGTLVYTLTLTNNTAAAISVHAISVPDTTPAADVKVTGPTGTVSFDPVPYPAPIANGTLLPGQSISTTQTATGFATAGTYSAVAIFGDDIAGVTNVGPLTVTVQ